MRMEKLETIHDRISLLVSAYGEGKNTVFANIIGENEANIRGYRSNIVPKHPFLEKIVKSLDVSADWLLTGRGEMRISPAVDAGMTNQGNNEIIKTLLDRIEEQAKQVGRLESEIETLHKKSANSMGAEDATCAAAVG